MAQTNTVSVFVEMTTVTASGVAGRPEDCSKLLLQCYSYGRDNKMAVGRRSNWKVGYFWHFSGTGRPFVSKSAVAVSDHTQYTIDETCIARL